MSRYNRRSVKTQKSNSSDKKASCTSKLKNNNKIEKKIAKRKSVLKATSEQCLSNSSPLSLIKLKVKSKIRQPFKATSISKCWATLSSGESCLSRCSRDDGIPYCDECFKIGILINVFIVIFYTFSTYKKW